MDVPIDTPRHDELIKQFARFLGDGQYKMELKASSDVRT